MKTTKSDAIPIYIPSYWTILWKPRNPIMSIVTFALMMKKYKYFFRKEKDIFINSFIFDIFKGKI